MRQKSHDHHDHDRLEVSCGSLCRFFPSIVCLRRSGAAVGSIYSAQLIPLDFKSLVGSKNSDELKVPRFTRLNVRLIVKELSGRLSFLTVGSIYSAQLVPRDFKSLPADLTPNVSQGKTR